MREYDKYIQEKLVKNVVEFLKRDLKNSQIKVEKESITIDDTFIIEIFFYDIYGFDFSRNHVIYFLFNKENNFPIYQSKDFYRVYRELRKEMKRL